MDLLLTILICMVIVVPFAVLGRTIQKVTKFVAPIEFLTMIILAGLVIFAYSLKEYAPWTIPAVFGYFLGYVLSARKEWLYITPIYIHTQVPNMHTKWIVPYTNNDGEWCIQPQRNIHLMKRLFLGVHYLVDTNVPLAPNCDHTFTPVYMVKMGSNTMAVDTCVEEKPYKIKAGRWTVKQYKMKIRVAPPMVASVLERMVDNEAHLIATESIIQYAHENVFLERAQQDKFMESSIEFVRSATVKKTPQHAFMERAGQFRKQHTEIFETVEDETASEDDNNETDE